MSSPFNSSLDLNNSTTNDNNIVYKPSDTDIIYSDNIIYGNENISNNLANTNYYYRSNSYRTISSLAAGSLAGSSILLGRHNHNLSTITDLNDTTASSNECNNSINNQTTVYYGANESVTNNNTTTNNNITSNNYNTNNNLNLNNIYNNKTENCSLAEHKITTLSNNNYLNSTTKANKIYDDHNLLSSTLNQIDKEHQFCHKSYFDKLPPDIEISVYGSETLPENSVLEADNTANTSGGETDNSCVNNYLVRSKKLMRSRCVKPFMVY